jgi:uncharacterized membrane protein YkoI
MTGTITHAARIAPAILLALVCAVALGPAGAQELSQDVKAQDATHPVPTAAGHVCLNQKERRAEADSGRLVRLSSAMHAAKSRMPGTVVRARLCRGPDDGLVYVLTVLAHDGKVSRISVDAANGTLVGER